MNGAAGSGMETLRTNLHLRGTKKKRNPRRVRALTLSELDWRASAVGTAASLVSLVTRKGEHSPARKTPWNS